MNFRKFSRTFLRWRYWQIWLIFIYFGDFSKLVGCKMFCRKLLKQWPNFNFASGYNDRYGSNNYFSRIFFDIFSELIIERSLVPSDSVGVKTLPGCDYVEVPFLDVYPILDRILSVKIESILIKRWPQNCGILSPLSTASTLNNIYY